MRFNNKPNVSTKVQRYTAFTLAEVLITLGIIGVVASLTIPTLMNNIQNQQFVSGLQKTYSSINQALLALTHEYDCSNDLVCTGLMADTGDARQNNINFGDAFVKHFKVVKNCKVDEDTGCGASDANGYYDGTYPSPTDMDWPSYYRFITSDGVIIRLYVWGDDCAGSNSLNVTNDMTQICGMLAFDVNGIKKPNRWGRDIFIFDITNGHGAKIYPEGGPDDGSHGYWKDSNNCTKAFPRGWYCAARIMDEGWKMNY